MRCCLYFLSLVKMNAPANPTTTTIAPIVIMVGIALFILSVWFGSFEGGGAGVTGVDEVPLGSSSSGSFAGGSLDAGADAVETGPSLDEVSGSVELSVVLVDSTEETTLVTLLDVIGLCTVEEVGFVTEEVGLDAVEVGVVTVEVGLDAVEVGVVTVEVGLDAVEVGVVTVEVGLDAVEVGVVTVEVGLDAVEVGAVAVEVGAVAVEVGADSEVVAEVDWDSAGGAVTADSANAAKLRAHIAVIAEKMIAEVRLFFISNSCHNNLTKLFIYHYIAKGEFCQAKRGKTCEV